jgi:crossover junction endodeoxyribonuclease RuvC
LKNKKMNVRRQDATRWPSVKGVNETPRKSLIKSEQRKVVLGIDPGLARMGFGAVYQENGKTRVLSCGTLTTPAHTSLERRLADLFGQLRAVLEETAPAEVAMEELFFSRNAKTAIAVGQARGVALLACGLAGLPVHEYRPMEVKQAVAGYGSADKQQVQKMVKLLLGLVEAPKPDDTADALAIALTHTHCSGTRLSEEVKRLSRTAAAPAFRER